jgi:ABC-2 type transport system permease protein
MTGAAAARGLDLRPDPAAAPALRRVLRHAGVESRLLLRNGEQLLLALLIPLGLLFLARLLGGRVGDPAVLVPSVLALAWWSSTFTSLAIATGFERRYGVLERLAATPLGKSGLVAGKALSTGSVAVGQLVVLVSVGFALGWRPALSPLSWLCALIGFVLAGLAFSGTGLLLAGRLRAEVTLAVANLVYLLGLAAGLVVPLSSYPSPLRPVLSLLPTAALGEGLRAYAIGLTPLWPLAVLAVWALLAVGAAVRGFRWTA